MKVSSTKCTSNKRARNIQNMPKTWVHITPTVCQGPLHYIPQWNINYFCTKTTSCHSYPVWLCLSHSRKQKLRQQDEWSRKRGCSERSLPLNYTFACPHCSSPFSAIQLNSDLTSPKTIPYYRPLNFLIPLTKLSLLEQLWDSNLAPHLPRFRLRFCISGIHSF